VLVQFALIAFALSGLLSLVVDIGYARLTQVQMQNAADAGALEGLRQRDNAALDVSQRRASANNVVGWTFDDDLDPTNGDADYQFGAGPVVNLTDGVTTAHALQTISVPDVHVYKPSLQPNLTDSPEGDMVSGHFCYTSDPHPSEDASYELQDIVCNDQQRGTGSYARNDFNPGAGASTPNAFLVRLRRSNEYQGLENQTDPDVASSGPSLPLTFGKGTTIHGDDPSSDYSVRRDGLTVRATAIADTRSVLHLGAPQPGQLAIAPFVLIDTCGQNPTGAPVTIPVTINPTTGVITRTNAPGAPPGCGANTVVGRFISNPAMPLGPAVSAAVRTVGAPAPTAASATPCQLVPQTIATRYVAVYSQMSTGPNRIIGFARGSLTRQAACPGAGRGGVLPPFTATIVRAVSAVAPSNATAILWDGFPAGVPPALVAELLDKNLARNGQVNYGPVFAPVLAR
jgi:Putative Flp pilus-assembly TadE/G-like